MKRYGAEMHAADMYLDRRVIDIWPTISSGVDFLNWQGLQQLYDDTFDQFGEIPAIDPWRLTVTLVKKFEGQNTMGELFSLKGARDVDKEKLVTVGVRIRKNLLLPKDATGPLLRAVPYRLRWNAVFLHEWGHLANIINPGSVVSEADCDDYARSVMQEILSGNKEPIIKV